MKSILLLIVFSLSLFAYNRPDKILCYVGNQAAPQGPGYPQHNDKFIQSSSTKAVKLGSWPEEGIIYRSGTTSVVQYGFFINTQEELEELKKKNDDFRFWVKNLNFEQYLERQKERPHAINSFVSMHLTSEGIDVTVRKILNEFNLSHGLLVPYHKPEETFILSYENLELPFILNGVAISCHEELSRNVDSYKKEIKRLKKELKEIKSSR